MLISDFLRFTSESLIAHRLRTGLTVLGIAVGIAAVVLLTSLAEGLHQYVLSEFTQFGSNLVTINPGKTSTHGGGPGVFGSVRSLTLEDSEALRRVPYAEASVPVVQGNAEVKSQDRSRRSTVFGVGPDFPQVIGFQVAVGRFLPQEDPRSARAFAVLGSKLKQELYGEANPLGQRIRIAGSRFRVIGVMESKGQILGFDIDDAVYIPAAKGLEVFNREGLMEIDLIYTLGAPVDIVVEGAKKVLIARHGSEDFTITTQQQMLEVLSSVLNVLTFAVAALGGISLLVGSVGIVTIMTIAVNERTHEVGLLRALGARRSQILFLFLGEAVVLASLGGLAGLIIGVGGAQLLSLAIPGLPVSTPWSYAIAAEVLAAIIGLAAGLLPARKAARLEPVEALRAE